MKRQIQSALFFILVTGSTLASEISSQRCLESVSETYCETNNKAGIIIETSCKNDLVYLDLESRKKMTLSLKEKSSRDARSFDENGHARGLGFVDFLHAATLGMSTQIFIGTSTNATVVENMENLRKQIDEKINADYTCENFVDSSNIMVPQNSDTYKY